MEVPLCDAAAHYPAPETWADTAVPYLPGLKPGDNGKSLTVPGM